MTLTKTLKTIFGCLVLLLVVVAGSFSYLFSASLPGMADHIAITGLSKPVAVDFDNFDIPAIQADNPLDAYRVLGYLHAQDRLFQMELSRRKGAGRLAEIFGAKAVELDKAQRDYGLAAAAQQVVQALPARQQAILAAYTAGINAYLTTARILPPEFIALDIQPEAWQMADSILVAYGMFQMLNGYEQDERMVSVMETALPPALLAFLTPDTDIYATTLLGGPHSHRQVSTIPVADFQKLTENTASLVPPLVNALQSIAGSNNWVVAGSKTQDGRAMIANDMHIALNTPNIWYRAGLHFAQQHLNGLTIPGLPMVVVGANQQVAWGFTNATADLLDLIRLDINPQNDQEYLTSQGWQKFNTKTTVIKVKGEPDIQHQVRTTQWGPVSAKPLLGQPVAIKWIALETAAVDLGLLDMADATSTEAAMAIMNNAGSPPQNVVLADSNGHIGWTYMGHFPKRKGFDGISSQSWADGNMAWDGFIPAPELPRLYDPQAGFIVTANQRTLGTAYPYKLGYNWALAYRAYRITELLQEHATLTEQDMLNIQLDTRNEVLEFYRQLALQTLTAASQTNENLRLNLQALQDWDQHMNLHSKGAALLNGFRTKLAEGVFAKVVAHCRQYDPQFNYAWREMETPLRELLTQQPNGVLAASYHDNWHTFIAESFQAASAELSNQYPGLAPGQLSWGTHNRIIQQHPFSKVFPLLANTLNISEFESDGCASFCVKVMSNINGASERLVVSPAHPEDGILEMPGGQSGHPFSKHYRDQQEFWQAGKSSPFLPSAALKKWLFTPSS